MRSVHLVCVAAGLLLAALVASLLALRGGADWGGALLVSLPMGFVYSAICMAARYPCGAAPLGGGVVRIALTHGGAALLSAGFWVLVGSACARLFSSVPVLSGLPAQFASEAPVLLVVGVLVYLLAVTVHYLVIAMLRAREAEVGGMRASVLAREAELRALRAQVDPHFLFNSLNSISALTAENAEGARRMCLLLAGFLRRSLLLGARERITLGEELRLVADYLAVEKVRFGDRLQIRESFDPAAASCAVPPLLLQPLVENAVRHGIAHLLEGGAVGITTARHGDRLLISVDNPRDDGQQTRRGAGVGLANVGDRLRSLYGDAARFDVRAETHRFRVDLALPAVTGPEAVDADRS